MLRLAEYEAALCTCGCGLPVAVAHKKQVFDVTTYTCEAGRAIQQARRMAAEDAKRAGKKDGWDDGLYYLARPVDPEQT